MNGAWGAGHSTAIEARLTAQALDLALTTSGSLGVAPVGAIVAWTNHITGTPALPANWELCDGTPVANTSSPMVGQNKPSLNGAGGTGHFLRGSDVTGTIQAQQVITHNHAFGTLVISPNPHSHGVANSGANASPGLAATNAISGTTPTTSVSLAIAGSTDVPSTANGTETRPINMSVKWIIRVV